MNKKYTIPVAAVVVVLIILVGFGIWAGDGSLFTGALRLKKAKTTIVSERMSAVKKVAQDNKVIFLEPASVVNEVKKQPEVQSRSYSEESLRGAALPQQTPQMPQPSAVPASDLSGISRSIGELLALNSETGLLDDEIKNLLNQAEFGQNEVYSYCQNIGNAIPNP